MARIRTNGGLIGNVIVSANSSVASGMFSMIETNIDRYSGNFPIYAPPVFADTQFNLNTLLIHADGSNGANNNTFLDSSTNAQSITRSGTPTQGTFSPFSQTGWSAYFSGTTSAPDWISTASSSIYNVSSGNWTIEAWFYNTSTDVSNRYITFTPASGTIFGLIPAGGNYFAINQFGTTSPVTTSASTVKLNQWSHVAIVKNGSTTYVYIDGVLGGSGTVSWSNSAHTIYFGGNGGSYAYNYNGWISNARIVMGTALYSGSTYTVPTAPLTAITNTQFLTLNNNRFYDSSNGYAVLLGVTTGPTVQSFSPFAPASAYGVSSVGGSMYTGTGGSGYGGGTGWIQTASSSAINIGTGAFTVEFWLYKLSNVPGNYSNYFGLNNYTNGILFRDEITAGSDAFYIGGTAYNIQPQTYIPLNQWVHVAVTRNASGNFALFANGSRFYSGTNAYNLGSSAAIAFADVPTGSAGASNPPSCYMSNMRITNTAVYDPTLTSLTVPTAPLTAISGTLFLCSATNSGIYDSTAKNNLVTGSTAVLSTTQSKFGGSSMYFDGTSGGVVYTAPFTATASPISAPGAFLTSDFTVEMWVNATASGGYQCFVTNRNSAGGTGTWFFGLYTGTTQVVWLNGGAVALTSTAISTGAWHHVAVSRSGSTIRLFIDGALAASTTDTTNYSVGGLSIGYDIVEGGYPYTGYIDEFRVSRYARYTAAFTAPTSPFLNQ
jgi:Concanavalin A-like lectin/glucanases superfamily